MNLNKFTKKAGAVVISASMLMGMMSPAMAAAVRYPVDAPAEGVRMSMTDTEGDLGNLVLDFASRSEQETYDLGTAYLYGNDENDDDGANSYDNFVFNFSDTPDAFALVSRNASNSNNVVYDIVAYDGTDVMTATEVTDEPSLSTSSLQDFYDTGRAGTAFTGEVVTATSLELPGALTDTIGKSDLQVGDPDVMTDYFDEVYVYVQYGENEYAYYVNLELGEALQDTDTAEVSAVKVVTRGTASRVDIALPKDMAGVADFEVEINGVTPADLDYVTHYPVVFFPTAIDDNIDVTVYTVNAEGTKSEDGVENNDNDAERVEISTALDDIDTSVFAQYITYLYKLSIIDGANGSYMPKDSITRGAMAKFVMNAFRLPFNIGGEQFSDVNSSNTFFAYIQSLKNAGVVTGADNKYMPDASVDRGSVTKFVVNAARYYDADAIGNGSCDFTDESDAVFKTFESYICSLADFGDDDYQKIVKGYSSGAYGAADKLDRQAMAKIILNAAALIPVVDGEDDTFINANYDNIPFASFPRPFVAPVEVANFDAGDETETSATLTWDDLSDDDPSVDGYIVERKERDDAEDAYEVIDVVLANIVSTPNADDADNKEGVFLTSADATIEYIDEDVNDDTRYDYRIAAFKFIPADYAEEDLTQAELQAVANYDDRTNMVIGSWVTTTAKTPAND